jgi:hypothetical protein
LLSYSVSHCLTTQHQHTVTHTIIEAIHTILTLITLHTTPGHTEPIHTIQELRRITLSIILHTTIQRTEHALTIIQLTIGLIIAILDIPILTEHTTDINYNNTHMISHSAGLFLLPTIF